MNLDWHNTQLLADGKRLHDFGYPIRGALEHQGVIVVLLDGPKASERTHPELIDEMNRNVYGLNPDGTIKWRIASHGSEKLGSMYYENPFLSLAVWGDAFILYNGDGPNRTLDVQTGKTEYLSPKAQDDLLAEAKRTNRKYSSPDTRGLVS